MTIVGSNSKAYRAGDPENMLRTLRAVKGAIGDNQCSCMLDGTVVPARLNVVEAPTYKGTGSVDTTFTGVDNDIHIVSPGWDKAAIFRLPAAASAAVSASLNGENIEIILASSVARITTQAVGGGSEDWAVSNPSGDTWRFEYNGDSWDLSTVVVGDVVTLAGFTANNNGTFKVITVDDDLDYIEVISLDGTVEATAGTSIIMYPLNTNANTGILVAEAIDDLDGWSAANAEGNDGTGSIETEDFTIAGADENIVTVTTVKVEFPSSNYTEIIFAVINFEPDIFGSDRIGEMIWNVDGQQIPRDQYTEFNDAGIFKLQIEGDWTVTDAYFEGFKR